MRSAASWWATPPLSAVLARMELDAFGADCAVREPWARSPERRHAHRRVRRLSALAVFEAGPAARGARNYGRLDALLGDTADGQRRSRTDGAGRAPDRDRPRGRDRDLPGLGHEPQAGPGRAPGQRVPTSPSTRSSRFGRRLLQVWPDDGLYLLGGDTDTTTPAGQDRLATCASRSWTSASADENWCAVVHLRPPGPHGDGQRCVDREGADQSYQPRFQRSAASAPATGVKYGRGLGAVTGSSSSPTPPARR